MPGASYTPRDLIPTKRFSTRCVADADAVLAAERVGLLDGLEGRHRLAVDGGRPALRTKRTLTLSGLSGASLGNTPMPGVTNQGSVVEVFELAGLVRQAEQVGVGGVRGDLARLDRQLVRVAVVDHLGTAAELARGRPRSRHGA